MNPVSMRSVRPPTISLDVGGGPAGGVDGRGRRDRRVRRFCSSYSQPVCPVAEAGGDEEEHFEKLDEITSHEEEEARLVHVPEQVL